MQEPRVKRHRIVVDDSALANRIGERIRHARREAGMTQQQLAEGRYTKAYISALEKGHAKPSMAALNFISERLGLPPSRFLVDSGSAWHRISADLLLASGHWDEAVEAYRELVEQTVDRGARAELLRGLAEGLCRLEHAEAAIAAAAESAELFAALGRPGDAALSTYWLANAQFLVDNRAEARALLHGLLEQLRTDGDVARVDPDLRMRVLMALASVESASEDDRAALGYLEEARGLAGDLDDWRRAAFLSILAENSSSTGDLDGAIRSATESLALFRATSASREAAVLENNLAMTYLRVGDSTKASELVSFARARHEAAGDRRLLAHVAETEAQIALAQSRYGDAVKLASEAIELAEATGNTRALTSALLTTARAEAADGRGSDAAESYRRAVEVLRTVGPVARLQQGLGEWAEILASMGRHEEAYALTREALQATTLQEGRASGASAARPARAPARRPASRAKTATGGAPSSQSPTRG